MRKTILTLALLTSVAMGATNKSTCDASLKATSFLQNLIINHMHEPVSGVNKMLISNKYALPYCIKAYGNKSKIVSNMKKNIKTLGGK